MKLSNWFGIFLLACAFVSGCTPFNKTTNQTATVTMSVYESSSDKQTTTIGDKTFEIHNGILKYQEHDFALPLPATIKITVLDNAMRILVNDKIVHEE